MSILQTTQAENTIHQPVCPQCNALLPPRATFCGSCGERVKEKEQTTVIDEEDIHQRYRITTLVRRRPHINLYFAQDTLHAATYHQPRMVAIRDIEIAGLDPEARAEALTLAQQEYDRLRRWHIPHILTSMEMRVFQDHLFLISGVPFLPRDAATSQNIAHLYTLQDFLQSGQGLPKEARVLTWLRSLCQAVERLHHQHIVLGELDPYTVVLNRNSVEAEARLMISWIQPDILKLLAEPIEEAAPHVSYFSAPEALAGAAEVSSDVYSLGALLYLLLTGTPPDESTLRHRRRLRNPRELNARISAPLDECIMQALALDPKARFNSAATLLAALDNTRSAKQPAAAVQAPETPPDDAETVRIIPLSRKDMTRWRAAKEQAAIQNPQRVLIPPLSALIPQNAPDQTDTPVRPATQSSPPSTVPALPASQSSAPSTVPALASLPPTLGPRQSSAKPDAPPLTPTAPKPTWKKRITGILPTLKSDPSSPPDAQSSVASAEGESQQVPTPKKASPLAKIAKSATEVGENSLLKQVQQLLMGQQQHAVEATAIIETPMRIRPDQAYQLRLHIMGRDVPTPHPKAKKGALPVGLSALAHGEAIQVEVRSVLQQGYTYVLQYATVTIPAQGYAAEITIPMQPHPQVGIVTSRRERLHIFFLDSQRRPLYEKPFVVEVFVSPHVQLGREGHHVLPIPL